MLYLYNQFMSLVKRIKTRLHSEYSHFYFLSSLLVAIIAALRRRLILKGKIRDLPFSTFLSDLNSGAVQRVLVGEGVLGVTLTKSIISSSLPSSSSMVQSYTTTVPAIVDYRTLWKILSERPNRFEIIADTSAKLSRKVMSFVYTVAPVAYLAIVMYFLNRLSSNGVTGKGNDSPGRISSSSDDSAEGDSNRVGFDDVAGLGKAKEECQNIVHLIKNRTKYRELGARQPKGVLFYGPAGVGKTLLARAVAREADVPFLFCSGSDFVEVYVGRGAARVRSLFEKALAVAPCIIFIDEIDAMAKSRGGLNSSDEREQTLNQLLTEMDGFENSNTGVLVIAATNRPEVLDKAVLRSGRFDLHIRIPLPDEIGRENILRIHLRKIRVQEPEASSAHWARCIARETDQWTGADLASLVNEAALFAARRDACFVEEADMSEALHKLRSSRLSRAPKGPKLAKEIFVEGKRDDIAEIHTID